MSIISDFPHILHGGDYNPDQWQQVPGTVDKDFALMDKAHCNTFSVAIFSWAQIETAMDHFEFGWLDDIFDRCAASGRKLFLATASASKPNWLANRYPEILRIGEDGKREPFWARANCCYSSAIFRERVRIINSKLAERYAHHPALGGWHISNEYNGECWCEKCRKRFAEWLQKRYGTIENLNRVYWSAFWGHTYERWEDVEPRDFFIGVGKLDWQRFCTEVTVEFMNDEIATVRQFSDKPATTNMMGFFPSLDYWKMVDSCDFIADDCYPDWHPWNVVQDMTDFAMRHDCHYTMKNKPFLLMESCPGVANYHEFPKLRRPNEFEREMLLALGHGADGTMYFQWRKGRANCEMFHGAVVGHDGTDQTMSFKRVANYGAKLPMLDDLVDSRRQQDVAVYYDWESDWALKITCLGSEGPKKYQPAVQTYYHALWNNNYDIAVIDETPEISRYKLVVAPMLFMVKAGVVERWKAFVEAGGTLVLGYFTGYVDQDFRAFDGGNPCGWAGRELCGVWNEDIDIMAPAVEQSITWKGKKYKVTDYAEYLHLEGDAEAVAYYDSQFYAGTPAITCRKLGKGHIYYVGTRLGVEFLQEFLGELAESAGVKSVMENLPETIRVSRRIGKENEYYFFYNLTEQPVEVTVPADLEASWSEAPVNGILTVPASGATILKRKKQ